MLSYEFKTYISNDTEYYYRVAHSLEDSVVRTGSDIFPSALISFLDLDVSTFAPVFQKIADLLWSLTLTKETRFADEAKDLLYQWFGFAREKIKIHHSVPQYEVNRHRMLRKVGEIERLPLYNATDWNYIRFDCGCMCYELQNDDLRPYRF